MEKNVKKASMTPVWQIWCYSSSSKMINDDQSWSKINYERFIYSDEGLSKVVLFIGPCELSQHLVNLRPPGSQLVAVQPGCQESRGALGRVRWVLKVCLYQVVYVSCTVCIQHNSWKLHYKHIFAGCIPGTFQDPLRNPSAPQVPESPNS